MSPDPIELHGIPFRFVAEIQPERDTNGAVLEFRPQGQYQNHRNLPLNAYGNGPFCRFRIPECSVQEGVYAILNNDEVSYIGKCANLQRRFGPTGYGAIQPRNCYKEGQSTNCKINNFVFEKAKLQEKIELWFHPSLTPASVEMELIDQLKPPWNGRQRRAREVIIPENLMRKNNLEDIMPIYRLILHPTYYNRGFFNVTVQFDRFVGREGPLVLALGTEAVKIAGHINRTANNNGTARIFGGTRLRDWFQLNYNVGDTVEVDLTDFQAIRLC